jgi:hypothetical protein
MARHRLLLLTALVLLAVAALPSGGIAQERSPIEDQTARILLRLREQREVEYGRLLELARNSLQVQGTSFPVIVDADGSRAATGNGLGPIKIVGMVSVSSTRSVRVTYLSFMTSGIADTFITGKQPGTLQAQIPAGKTAWMWVTHADARGETPALCYFSHLRSRPLVSAVCIYRAPGSAFVAMAAAEEKVKLASSANYTGSIETKRMVANFVFAAAKNLAQLPELERSAGP